MACSEQKRELLRCRVCGTEWPAARPLWRCACGGLLDLEFQAGFDKDAIRHGPPTLWRYADALPLRMEAKRITLGEGYTPLVPFVIGSRTVELKLDHLFPTGSYKDRGAVVMINKVRDLGVKRVVEDSSGNAGCAVAAYCAAAGVRCEVYVPAATTPAKLIQIRAMGAYLHLVPGSREDTAAAAMTAAGDAYYASHSWNPYFFHGTKTIAYEIWEQSHWRAPDTMVVPAGNGTLLLGAYIGFKDLLAAGMIERLPRLIAIQAAACDPLVQAFERGGKEPAVVTGRATLAEGIAIAAPVRGAQILEAVRDTGGRCIAVEEEEIRWWLLEMGRRGYFVEPTAAVVMAGLQRYLGGTGADESVTAILTGHGLKSAARIGSILEQSGASHL
ncbi:threonine synthase [bacterium]|nr:threonine synthase [candidate division CSSED10-310 bacterium]